MTPANAYTLLVAILVWILSVVGVGFWQYDAGRTFERVEWQTKETQRLRELNSENDRLRTAAIETERQHAAALASISTSYQEKLNNEKAQTARLRADLRSGTVRLRLPDPKGSTGIKHPAEPSTSAGRCNGSEGGELPPATAEFLYTLAADADEITEQLAACQAVVQADRAINSLGEQRD